MSNTSIALLTTLAVAVVSLPAAAPRADGEQSVVSRLSDLEAEDLIVLRIAASSAGVTLESLADRARALEAPNLLLLVSYRDEVLSADEATPLVDRLVAATAGFAELSSNPMVVELGLEAKWEKAGAEVQKEASGLALRLERDLQVDVADVVTTLLRIGSTSGNTLELLHSVYKEAIQEDNENKTYFEGRLEQTNAMGSALSDYLHQLSDSTGSVLRIVGGCPIGC
jgi:hypothetical protein